MLSLSLLLNSLQGNSSLLILDELLLDIFKHSSEQSITVEAMEKSVAHRTGRNFSTLHNIVLEPEIGSQGIEDFIDNDSLFFNVHHSVVTPMFALWPPNDGYQVLDLTKRHVTSCQDLVEKCVKARNASCAILRGSTFSCTAWPFSVLDLLCWFCPSLRQIDITGCTGFSRDILSSISDQHKIEIIDYLDPSFILRCSDAGTQIRQILEDNSISPGTNCMGWSLLHSAILLGDVELVRKLLECIHSSDDNNNINIPHDLLQTSLELATALHHLEIVELSGYENIISMDPFRLIQFCFLKQHGIKIFDHPIEALTSNEAAKQTARNLHNSQDCNVIALLQLFCKNSDTNFKKKVLEEIFLQVHDCIRPESNLFFSCWNENAICYAVQFLMEETGISASEKVDNCPYLIFSLPSVRLLEFLLLNGAKIDEKDQSGCTALFHAVEKALTSPSPYCSSWNERIKYLLHNQANPNTRNDLGETPLLFSLRHVVFASRLADSFEDQVVEVWKILLNAKARANTKDEMDRSLLHLLLTEFLETGLFLPRQCLKLVCKGLPVLRNYYRFLINTRDSRGNTPLHLWAGFSNKAISAEVIDIGNEIINHGGAVDARNDNGETPLHLAWCWKQVEILVEKGAQSFAQDLKGNTPLHKFIEKHSLIRNKVTKSRWEKILAWGMNPFCANSNNECPFDVLLQERFFKSALSLLKAIFENEQNHKDLAESARRYKDRKGDSLLHVLCVMDDKGAQTNCEYLLQNGCNVNFQNKCKETPLHMVCRKVVNMNPCVFLQSAEKFILLLRKYHADVSIPDGLGNSCEAMSSGNEYLHKLLHEDIEKVSISNKIKWIPKSANHKAALTDVARGVKSRKVESYHHHENHIGKGSFSLVFPALNETDGREVAMKRLEKERLEEKGALLEREVKCLLQLSNCRFVVNYISCTSDSNFQYLVVELMEGSLEAYLSYDQECEHAFTICLHIASGTEFLHANDVVHRDLKPQNILYQTVPNFIVKISDFGLSKILHAGKSSAQSETVMHSRAGTRCWMAPELLGKKPKNHSKASDIFSCGLLFHYILAKKKHPFGAYSEDSPLEINPQETEENIRKCKRFFCPTLAAEACHLLTNMLSRKTRRRPAALPLKQFPFFWNDREKVDFLTKVGNQREFEEPRLYLSRPLTDVENKLEAGFRNEGCDDWEAQIQEVYDAVTNAYEHRIYDTTSAVELVRFIRNSYFHSHDLPRNISDLLWEKFVFLERFPFLVTAVYESVKVCDTWTTRKELKKFFR